MIKLILSLLICLVKPDETYYVNNGDIETPTINKTIIACVGDSITEAGSNPVVKTDHATYPI